MPVVGRAKGRWPNMGKWGGGGLLTLMLLFDVATAGQWEPLPETAPAPPDNPTTEAKVKLGKELYFDPRISDTGTVSCNSCHNVSEGGDDGLSTSIGIRGRAGPRNAPTVWNAAFNSTQFWDGRADSLEEQAKGPIVTAVEMGMPSQKAVVERLRRIPGYRKEFEEVFGQEQSLTMENIAKAIAAYERTLITPNSPFDRYLKGDKSALTKQQRRGMQTFNQVGCTNCHFGPAFNGPQANMAKGKGFYQKFPVFSDNQYIEEYNLEKDLGRYGVTGKEGDKHRFKVPILRNVALTAPYFHNGSVRTLEQAVRVMAKVQLDKALTEQQVSNIVAFLRSLTGEFPKQILPRLPYAPGKALLVEDRDLKAGHH